MYSLHQTFPSKNKGLSINGVRPTPLRINKSSNPIQKRPLKRPNEPVIIYAESPKVIHTRPQDFMALVQRLTGRNRCLEDLNKGLPVISEVDQDKFHGCDYEDGRSSDSSLSDDQKINCGSDQDHDNVSIKEEDIGCYLVSPTMFMAPKKASIGDIPLYTPTGMQWLSSSSSYTTPSL